MIDFIADIPATSIPLGNEIGYLYSIRIFITHWPGWSWPWGSFIRYTSPGNCSGSYSTFSVAHTRIPTVKEDILWVQSTIFYLFQYVLEVIILCHPITVMVINPEIQRDYRGSVTPQQCDQTYLFDNLMVLSAPMVVYQFNLMRIRLVQGGCHRQS